jgi:hypothetical protein
VALLNIIMENKNSNPIKIIDNPNSMHDMIYTEINSDLYRITKNNRMIGLYDPSICKFEKTRIDQQKINLNFK